MTLSLTAMYAALADNVYQRNANDVPLPLDVITGGPTIRILPKATDLSAANLVQDPNTGMIYSGSQSGFAAEVLRINGRFVVVFRGTDTDNSTDKGDISADITLGSGGVLGGQIADMQHLMSIVNSLTGAAGNVTIVGQSLGGGLALLAGATYGVETYAYDPAPFASELATLAMQAAAKAAGVPDNLLNEMPFLTDDTITDWQNHATSNFVTSSQTYYQQFISNLANNSLIHAYRVDGEFLSVTNNPTSFVISAAAQRFDSSSLYSGLPPSSGLQVQVSEAGRGDQSYDDAGSLHSPSLMALLLKDPTFGQITLNDASLRYALFDGDHYASGKIDGDWRADPENIDGVPITSRVQGGVPNPSTLYRALWLNDNFEAQFEKAFTKIDYGAAGEGADPTTFNSSSLTVHSSLVELGLRVIRDGLHSGTETDPSDVVSDDAKFIFDPVENGQDLATPDGNFAIVKMSDIQPESYLDGVDIDHNRAFLDSNFIYSTGYHQLGTPSISTPRTVLPWEVLVVQDGFAQDGTTGAAMHYTPSESVADKSHMIIGGSGDDVIHGSSATDYIMGGDGNDTFVLGNEPGGGGRGDYIDGGQGFNTIDYSASTSAIQFNTDGISYSYVGPRLSYLAADGYTTVSTDPSGDRYDVTRHISKVIGPSDPSFVNNYGVPQPAVGSDDPTSFDIVLNGGLNNILIPAQSSTLKLVTIEGYGGFNSLYFQDTGWQSEVEINGVYQFKFWNGLEVDAFGIDAAYLQVPNSSWSDYKHAPDLVLDHGSESDGGGTLSVSSSQQYGTYTFSDSNSGNLTVAVENYSASKYSGTLSANLTQDPSTSGHPSTGHIDLAYTPNPNVKYAESDYFAVTVSDDYGYAKTFYVNEFESGLSIGSATAYMPGAAAGGTITSRPSTASSGRTETSGTIAISDSYAADVETASSALVSATGEPNGSALGTFAAVVKTDASGQQYVSWDYKVDDKVLGALATGANIQETYNVRLSDQYGMLSAPKNVVITISPEGAYAAAATTTISTPDQASSISATDTQNAYQSTSGAIEFSSSDPEEWHTVSISRIGTANSNAGTLQAFVSSDSHGTGNGEITWQYLNSDTSLIANGGSSESFDVAITGTDGDIVHQTISVAIDHVDAL